MDIPTSNAYDTPTMRGAVDDVPELPEGFVDTFSSRWVTAGEVRLHTVVGGDGPALLLLGGWPQTWYAWRHMMPAFAATHTVVAVDPRGTGLSDKPANGYDSATQADDMIRLMAELGFDTFDMVGHDVGMWTAFAVAIDHPGHVRRLAVAEAIIPGVSASPPLLGDRGLSDFLWHFNFNRAYRVNEQLVRGREDIYFGHQFATKAGRSDAVAQHAIDHYVEMLRKPDALRASFDYYRAIDDIIEQNARRREQRITIPVLAVAGKLACDGSVAAEMSSVADDVTSVILPGCGHYVPEEAPEAFVEAVDDFLRSNPG